MADQEHFSPAPSYLPEVSTAAIEAYKSDPRSFYRDFETLKRNQPAIARELTTGIEGVDPQSLELKRAFAKGALLMYT